MDFKAVPFGYFKEHICRDVFPVQKLLFLLVKFLLPLRFLQPAFLLFLFFLLLPSLFLFLPVRFTGLQQRNCVKSEFFKNTDRQKGDMVPVFRILKHIRNPVFAILDKFFFLFLPSKHFPGILPAREIDVFNLADHMEIIIVFIPVFVLVR